MKKKFLSYAMAASMVLTTVPSPALATEDVPAEVQEKDDEEQLKELDETGKGEAEKEEQQDELLEQSDEQEEQQESEQEEQSEEQEQQEEQSNDAQSDVIMLSVESESIIPDADALPDNDELFAGYAMQQFYGDQGIVTYGSMAGDRLTGLNQTIYNELKGKIEKVAAGTETSAEFTITADISSLSWTKEQLGVSGELTTKNEKNETVLTEAASKAFNEKFSEKVNTDKILNSLLADSPYELYWFDKTKNTGGMQCGQGMSIQGDAITVTQLTFSFAVASAYAPTDIAGAYTTDAGKTKVAAQAAAKAQAIVGEVAKTAETDEDTLTAYKEKICELVAYNDDAANASNNTAYGDPWQLIYVFDGDENTNVVCEGYAKAFQYLCDLSTFKGNTVCYTVTGTMTGGTGAGGHMWNLVKLNGGVLLVDVTNCDEGTIGYSDKLFLKSTENDGKTYTIAGVTYTYDADTLATYSADDLTLKAASETPELTEIEVPKAVSDLTYNGKEQTGVEAGTGYTLTGNTAIAAGENYTATATLDSGYKWKGEESTEAKNIPWSIEKKTPTADDFDLPDLTAQDYTGNPISVGAPTLKTNYTGAGTITVKYDGDETAPTDAGEYAVTFDVAEGDNFKAATDLSIGTLTIKEKAKDPAGVKIDYNLPDVTYGDENIEVKATVTNAGTNGKWEWKSLNSDVLEIVDGANSATVKVKVLKASDSGATLEVTYESDDTKGSATANFFTVARKRVSVSGITVQDKVYDGTTEATLDVSQAQITDALTGDNDLKVVYNGGATFADADAGTGKDVNVPEGALQLSGTNAENYTVTSWGDSFTGAINQAAYSGTPSTTKDVKAGAETPVSVSLAELLNGIDGVVDAEITSASATGDSIFKDTIGAASISTDKQSVAFTVLENAAAANTATVELKIKSKNYNEITANIVVNVTDKDTVTPTITGVPTSIAYGDTFTLKAAAEGADEADKWTWASTDDTVLQIEGSGVSVTVKAFKPGTATITASYDSDTATGTASTAELTVAKRVITVKADDKSITVGEVLPSFTVSYSNFASGDTEAAILDTTSVKAEVNTDVDGKTVGTFPIKVTVAPQLKDGMADKYQLQTVDGALTVKAKDSTGGGSSSGGHSGGYGGGGGSSKPSTTPSTKTDTTINSDGSTTKTETKSDGTTIETTTETDGTTTVTETKPDGTVTETVNNADGSGVKT